MENPTRPKRIRFQPTIVLKFPGILKIIELVLDAIVIILSFSSRQSGVGNNNINFMIFVGIFSFAYTLITLVCLVLNLQAFCLEKLWPLIEVIACVLMLIFYIIAGVLVATLGLSRSIYPAVAAFGFAAFIAYFVDLTVRIFSLVNYRPGNNSSSNGQSSTEP